MAGQEQGQQSAGSAMDFLWGVVLAVGICVVVWLTMKEQILHGLIQVKIFEINILQSISHSSELAQIKYEMQAYYPHTDKITFNQVATWLRVVGQGFNFPTGIILILFGILLFLTHPISKFCKTFDMKSMLESEKKYWPQIGAVSGLELIDKDINQGGWAMSLSPMPFAKKYKLLREERKQEEVPLFPGDDVTVTVRRDAARHVFTHQLGALWQGADKLPPHAQAIFVVLAARANRMRKPSDKILKQLARSNGKGTASFAGVKILMTKLKDCPIVKQLSERHAYVLTFMASLLELARDDGVLSTADFLWLKPLDRPLWYMLNNVGRRTAFCEVAGPWSHLQAEKKMGRKLFTPMVDEAVTALEKAIEDIVYVPDPQQQQGS